MPSHKTDLSTVSLAQIQRLTGKGYKTVKSRLNAAGVKPVASDKKTLYYDPPTALAAVYAPETLDVTKERVQLIRERRRKIQMENDLRAEELMLKVDALEAIGRFFDVLMPRVIAIPVKMAPIVFGCQSIRETSAKLRTALTECWNPAVELTLEEVLAGTPPYIPTRKQKKGDG